MRGGLAVMRLYVYARRLLGALGFLAITVYGSGTELLLDAEKLVVLSHTV